ncbi:MAG: beta-eliminating lyase-related protein, partial [Cyanobacteria bacterium]|nr:beta-eliminating lyase-related protein [Cyanobacteriota bacterium]
GSAANALALATVTPPYGAIYCHTDSHINLDECCAPEFYTGGAKLVPLPGDHGKITAADLATVLQQAGAGVVHHAQPATVSITQATEAGTVYTPTEIYQIAEVAHARYLRLHMDGARFANALVSVGCTPAELTWKAGVDVLSFGATKNGALAAEAVVFFDPDLAGDFIYRRKRGGHLFSKLRFLSAQLLAYLENDLWLRHATHANHMATQLAAGLAAVPGAELCHPLQTNELFIRLPETVITGLLAEGFQFYRWDGSTLLRLVTAFNTTAEDVNALIAAAHRYAANTAVSVG